MCEPQTDARLARIEALLEEILRRLDHDEKRSTYLTTQEAVSYLKFSSLDALYVWAHRQRVPKCRRGRTILFLRRDLDEAVNARLRSERRRR